jgi:hypothetical protein
VKKNGRANTNESFLWRKGGRPTANQPPILLSADISIDYGNVAHWQRSKRIDEMEAEKTAAFKPVLLCVKGITFFNIIEITRSIKLNIF